MNANVLTPVNEQERILMSEFDNICYAFGRKVLDEVLCWGWEEDKRFYTDYLNSDDSFDIEAVIHCSVRMDEYDEITRAIVEIEDYQLHFDDGEGHDLPEEVRPEFVSKYLMLLENKCCIRK